MIGSVFGHSIRESDTGMVNLSGLNPFLEEILTPYAFADGQLPALYGDAIFHNRLAMIGCPNKKQSKSDPELHLLHRRLASLRMKEEHVFADMNNRWKILGLKNKMKMYKKGEEVLHMLYMCFFLENCYICCCGNNMSKTFGTNAPTLEDYFGYFD
jgi:hypothetical protein